MMILTSKYKTIALFTQVWNFPFPIRWVSTKTVGNGEICRQKSSPGMGYLAVVLGCMNGFKRLKKP